MQDIPGYEGVYATYNNGDIWSYPKFWGGALHKGKFLKPHLDAKGYHSVFLLGKYFKVHRLVAMTYLPNPYNHPQINHKNGIRHDNRVENLEWCNNSHNQIHSYRELGRQHWKYK